MYFTFKELGTTIVCGSPDGGFRTMTYSTQFHEAIVTATKYSNTKIPRDIRVKEAHYTRNGLAVTCMMIFSTVQIETNEIGQNDDHQSFYSWEWLLTRVTGGNSNIRR